MFTTLRSHQLQILEDAFQNNHYPEVTTVDALAELLDVRHEKISVSLSSLMKVILYSEHCRRLDLVSKPAITLQETTEAEVCFIEQQLNKEAHGRPGATLSKGEETNERVCLAAISIVDPCRLITAIL